MGGYPVCKGVSEKNAAELGAAICHITGVVSFLEVEVFQIERSWLKEAQNPPMGDGGYIEDSKE